MILTAVLLNSRFYIQLLWFFSNLPTTQGPNAKCVRLEVVLGLPGTIYSVRHFSAVDTGVLLGLDLSLGSTPLISRVATEMSKMRYAERPDKSTRMRPPLIARSCTTQSTNVYRLLPIATARILSGKTVNLTQRTRVRLSLVNDD